MLIRGLIAPQSNSFQYRPERGELVEPLKKLSSHFNYEKLECS